MCKCNGSAYDDGINQQCVACSYKCTTCSAAGCLSCDATTRILSGSTCACLPKFFDNGASNACIGCPYSCTTCSNLSACTSCDSVTNHRIYNSSTQLCACQDQYYDVTSNPVCQGCSVTCYTCTTDASISSCTSCNIANYRQLATGQKCSCITGYY